MTTRPFPSAAASRRTALAAAVCLLCAASLQAADIEYVSLAGVKAQGFQKWLDDARDQGYEPNYVMGYDVGDHAEFAGVAIKDPQKRDFEAKYNMTSDDYQDWFGEMTKKGLRPTVVSGYMTNKGARFAAVFVKDKKPVNLAWEAKHNQSQKEYEKELKDQRKAGLEPRIVTAYEGADGAVHYTSLFYEPMPGWKWENRHNLTADQFQDQLDTWKDKGFRPTDVYAYDTPDGLRFLANAAKWDKEPMVWEEHHGMTGDQYQKKFDKLGGEGYRPNVICGYRDGGEVRFAAVWVRKND